MAKHKLGDESDASPSVSDEQIFADTDVQLARLAIWKIVASFGGLAVVTLAFIPIVYFLADVTTVSVTLGVSASLSLAATGTIGGVYGTVQHRRANRLEASSRELRRDVRELQNRLKDEGLPHHVSR